MSARSGALVLGVGNILWADEGFGVRCVEQLAAQYDFGPQVDIIDGGTQGLLLVALLQSRADLILLDAVDFGDPPGTLRMVEGRAIPSAIAARAMSLHQTGMADVLACADLLGAFPARALLIGAQPEVLEDYGGSLTPAVSALVSVAVKAALNQLHRWGYASQPARGGAAMPFDPSLARSLYEAGRPSADAACRIGDERVLERLGGS